MFDSRRYLGAFAIFALVILRLVIGWHFFREGTGKLEYDRHDGEFRLAFTSEGFLNNATGPMAGMYWSKVPDNHGARELLQSPRQNERATEEATDEAVRWIAKDARTKSDAAKKGEVYEVAFPTFASYGEWGNRIAADWKSTVAAFKKLPGLTDEQLKKADAALQSRLEQVKEYLAGEEEAITEYRHDLWRLAEWRKKPETGKLPFYDDRITAKAGELRPKSAPWINEVKAMEAQLHSDLRGLLTGEQRDQATTAASLDGALADPKARSLRTVDMAVTALTIGVGVCLLLGLFTRLASLVGAGFLLSVILSQPPWVASAAPTMPQVIEFASLLVLAGAHAGRWAGLDYFLYLMFHRDRVVSA